VRYEPRGGVGLSGAMKHTTVANKRGDRTCKNAPGLLAFWSPMGYSLRPSDSLAISCRTVIAKPIHQLIHMRRARSSVAARTTSSAREDDPANQRKYNAAGNKREERDPNHADTLHDGEGRACGDVGSPGVRNQLGEHLPAMGPAAPNPMAPIAVVAPAQVTSPPTAPPTATTPAMAGHPPRLTAAVARAAVVFAQSAALRGDGSEMCGHEMCGHEMCGHEMCGHAMWGKEIRGGLTVGTLTCGTLT
jgi:hypothetical protein